jgi:hypothetical protein
MKFFGHVFGVRLERDVMKKINKRQRKVLEKEVTKFQSKIDVILKKEGLI